MRMSALSSTQQLAALQHPWHTKRARPKRMLRSSTPCSSSHNSVNRITSPIDKENIRRQIVGFAIKRDNQENNDRKTSATTKSTANSILKKIPAPEYYENGILKSDEFDIINKDSPRPNTPYITQDTQISFNMPHAEAHPATRQSVQSVKRSKVFSPNQDKKSSAPKIVRFRMDEFKIGNTKAPIVTITDNISAKSNQENRFNIHNNCEIRGSAIAVRKEGLKGLLAYKDLCDENERRQTSMHNTVKLFKRRIRLNEERFIQPNESTREDYVIHSRSPCLEPHSPVIMEERPIQRPISSTDHVRLLRSALHNKHNGVNHVIKQSDNFENEEAYKNIKCSYRLPENHNWGKEVSFKDIKDDSIPNVKTYVLQEEGIPNAKFRKNNVESTVTLNTHNLNVHTSITQVNEQKIRVGETEVGFDPRFIDWLEESFANLKYHKVTTSNSADELNIECPTPPVRRKLSAKS